MPDLATSAPALDFSRSFLEAQLPVSKLSKECYKERKSNYSQTLTGLGKWWGRKPLILVRATILGLLLPVSDDPRRDREIFLKLLTMDGRGLARRNKGMPTRDIFARLTPAERTNFFTGDSTEKKARFKKPVRDHRAAAEALAFGRLTYDEKLNYCLRPEEISGPDDAAWADINAHLGTSATSLPELVRELGEKRFGRVPRVGDAFCGGGSIPFEAARIGCEAYGSDLNPVAALLTWAALHIVGGGPDVAAQVRAAQRRVWEAVDRQITAWGIEHETEALPTEEWRGIANDVEQGKLSPERVALRVRRADAYLYCAEVRCPETGWMVPLAPSWVIGENSRTVAKLIPDEERKLYRIEIHSGVSDSELQAAAESGTVRDGALIHSKAKHPTPISLLRRQGAQSQECHESGLRLWTTDDLVPRGDDVFQERLYCVRWVTTFEDRNADGEVVVKTERAFATPTSADLVRERKVLELLRDRRQSWQSNGFIPRRSIESGDETDRLGRERGWTHWHHLFNPRQLLLCGLINASASALSLSAEGTAASFLGVQRTADYNSRLSPWSASPGKELVNQVFANQALNTLSNFGSRGFLASQSAYFLDIDGHVMGAHGIVEPLDARRVLRPCDFWITDPPYADAINYHELSEFFLGWYGDRLPQLFSGWTSDARRALAVVGSDDGFRRSMVDCYRNLAEHMPDDGAQVVMFTHQDAAVWADLALILWAAGLRVTSAWCVATETDSARRTGNYVQGTVLLVLRKQTATETAYLDEIYPEVEAEVRSQLDGMLKLDDEEDPNFGDTDYQLAAYAAALRVLTRHPRLDDVDVAHELSRTRAKGETSPVERVIMQAVHVAANHLLPRGFDEFVWRTLTAEERFYLKALELQSHGEARTGAYQELARGFGLRDYTLFLAETKANHTRLHTPTSFGRRLLGDAGFGTSLVRHALFAVREVAAAECETASGRNWLQNEAPDYWSNRKTLIALTAYLARFEHTLPDWKLDGAAARLLSGALENDYR
jgi:adenine-specific DNA methylase